MKRNTLARQIRKAKGVAASTLAHHGDTVSPMEQSAAAFLFFNEQLCQERGAQFDAALVTPGLESSASNLCRDFLKIISTRDADALRAFADFLDRHDGKPADPLRASILCYRDVLNAKQKRITLAALARAMKFKGDMNVLRRLSKELHFPLLRDKSGPRRKRARR